VERHAKVRYRGYEPHGNLIDRSNLIDRTVNGFHARVVQHECDHLDGILYPMRLQDVRLLAFEEALFPDL
jgi:peptide deformylase